MRKTIDNTLHDKIKKQIAEFFEKGGSITYCETHKSGLVDGMFLKDKINSQKRVKK